uniref:Uncharacterized protein n=1 Tax=Anguilla anguilla TaxID=7936 RepID=A0A0E9SM66_ANGAN
MILNIKNVKNPLCQNFTKTCSTVRLICQ